jgi:hypothetical protein
MRHSDALPNVSKNSQVEVGVTEFSAVPAWNPNFGREREWSASGTHMLLNYLSDHIYERDKEGFRHVPVNKALITRAKPDDETEK